jgi:SAM-dependent methyltransferase
MIFSSVKNFLFVNKLTFFQFSILRILQILVIKKLKINGSILDAGSKKSISNVTNHLSKKYNIVYLDNSSSNLNDLNINLEIYPHKISCSFDNIFLMNVLEHIYNYQNCLNNCYSLLTKDGLFFGSTPFMFAIHPSPNDFHRYTEQSLRKSLEIAGFKNIEIQVLAGGIGICFYSAIFNITKKIPLINNFLIIFFYVFDKLIYYFSKNFNNSLPLGYFFSAKK